MVCAGGPHRPAFNKFPHLLFKDEFKQTQPPPPPAASLWAWHSVKRWNGALRACAPHWGEWVEQGRGSKGGGSKGGGGVCVPTNCGFGLRWIRGISQNGRWMNGSCPPGEWSSRPCADWGCRIRGGREAPAPGTKEGLHAYVYPCWDLSEMEMQYLPWSDECLLLPGRISPSPCCDHIIAETPEEKLGPRQLIYLLQVEAEKRNNVLGYLILISAIIFNKNTLHINSLR